MSRQCRKSRSLTGEISYFIETTFLQHLASITVGGFNSEVQR